MAITQHTTFQVPDHIDGPGAARQRYGVAFVLSGGAARGALQVGMLQVLLERGIRPDLIVGTSVGSFNGAWLASRPTLDGVRQLERIWAGVRYDHIFPCGLVGVMLHIVQHRPSFYDGEGIRRFLERTALEGGYGNSRFEDFPVSLAVVATNLTRGRPEIFDRGRVLPALLASAAIPAVLPPVTINGDQYVDGGLLDNVGLRVAIERGARRIYVLDTSWDGAADKPATSFDAVIDRSLQVVMAFHLQSALEYYARRAEIVLLRTDGAVAPNAADFSATARLVAAGRAAAENVLAAPEREPSHAIHRRRAAQWSAWPQLPPLRRWVRAALLREPASTSLSLPERLRLLAESHAASAPAVGAPRHEEATETLDPGTQQLAV